MTDERATERLVRVRRYTDERGRATAEVVGEPYADGDTLHVPIEVLTTGERHTVAFRLPETWVESSPVVRFVESVGYGPGGLDMLVGERFPVDLGGETPEPALDDPGDRGASDGNASDEDASDGDASDGSAGAEGRGDASAETVSGRAAAAAVGFRRLLRRAAVYAGLLAVFAVHVSVGALVAAAITSAIVFGGFLIATMFGWLGTVGTIGVLLGVGGVMRVIVARRARTNRSWNGVANETTQRIRPELFRDR